MQHMYLFNFCILNVCYVCTVYVYVHMHSYVVLQREIEVRGQTVSTNSSFSHVLEIKLSMSGLTSSALTH